MKKKIYFLLLIAPLVFLTACTSVKNNIGLPADILKSPKKGVSVTSETGNCNLGKYEMDCDVVAYLEEELAWTTEDAGIDFCAYALLGEEGESMYLQAHCEEYYIQDEKIACPDDRSIQECFSAKDAQEKVCEEKCKTQKVEPYLVTGSGVSITLKLTKTDNGYDMWQPRDGSFYLEDLRANFPKEIFDKIEDVDGGMLQSIIVERAEKYFGLEVSFEVYEETGKSCEVYAGCGRLPFEYAIKSDCPYTLKCLGGRCVIGCYDFSDYTRFPTIKEYAWDEIVGMVNQGEVKEVFQSHALDVELELKDGTKIRAKEPNIDAIFKVIDECGDKCKNIIKSTE